MNSKLAFVLVGVLAQPGLATANVNQVLDPIPSAPRVQIGAPSPDVQGTSIASTLTTLWNQPPLVGGDVFHDAEIADYTEYSTYLLEDVQFATDVNISAIRTWYTNSQSGYWFGVTFARLNIFGGTMLDDTLHNPTQGTRVPVTISLDGGLFKIEASGLDIDLPAGDYRIGLAPQVISGVIEVIERHVEAAHPIGLGSASRNPRGQWGFAAGTSWFPTGNELPSSPNFNGSIQILGTEIGTSLGTNYCTATPNSTGNPARIRATGSVSLAANDLCLSASGLPVGSPGLFYYGASQDNAPFGNGFRCVNPATGVFRLGVTTSDSQGLMSTLVDYTMPPQPSGQITAGSTWNFQAWYRDPAAGGAGFDLSDGLELTFGP